MDWWPFSIVIIMQTFVLFNWKWWNCISNAFNLFASETLFFFCRCPCWSLISEWDRIIIVGRILSQLVRRLRSKIGNIPSGGDDMIRCAESSAQLWFSVNEQTHKDTKKKKTKGNEWEILDIFDRSLVWLILYNECKQKNGITFIMQRAYICLIGKIICHGDQERHQTECHCHCNFICMELNYTLEWKFSHIGCVANKNTQ